MLNYEIQGITQQVINYNLKHFSFFKKFEKRYTQDASTKYKTVSWYFFPLVFSKNLLSMKNVGAIMTFSFWFHIAQCLHSPLTYHGSPSSLLISPLSLDSPSNIHVKSSDTRFSKYCFIFCLYCNSSIYPQVKLICCFQVLVATIKYMHTKVFAHKFLISLK